MGVATVEKNVLETIGIFFFHLKISEMLAGIALFILYLTGDHLAGVVSKVVVAAAISRVKILLNYSRVKILLNYLITYDFSLEVLDQFVRN